MKLALLVSFACVLIAATLAEQENDRAVRQEDLPEEISRRKRQVDHEALTLQELDARRQKTRPPGQRHQGRTLKKSMPQVVVNVEAPSSEIVPQGAKAIHSTHPLSESQLKKRIYSVPDLDPDSKVYDDLSDPDTIRVRVPHKIVYHTQLDDNDDYSDIQLQDHVEPMQEHRIRVPNKQQLRPRPVYMSIKPQRVTQETRYYRDPRPTIVRYPVAGDTIPNPDNVRVHRADPNIVVYQDQLDDDKNELGIEIKVSLNNQDLSPIKRTPPRPIPLHQSLLYHTDSTQQRYTS